MQKTEPIVLKISNTSYHVADVTLDYQKKSENIYYSPKEVVTAQIGKDLNLSTTAGRLDHFSFHTDGKVHEKYKGINRNKNKSSERPIYREIGELPGGLLPTDQSLFTPPHY